MLVVGIHTPRLLASSGPCKHLRREGAVDVAAFDGVAHDEVVAAPGMVRAESRAAARLQGASEIGFGERHHILFAPISTVEL